MLYINIWTAQDLVMMPQMMKCTALQIILLTQHNRLHKNKPYNREMGLHLTLPTVLLTLVVFEGEASRKQQCLHSTLFPC
jgi:hypothetical protein